MTGDELERSLELAEALIWRFEREHWDIRPLTAPAEYEARR